MRFANDQFSYGLISKILHWVIAFTMIGLIWLGWYMVDLSYYDRWYNRSLSLHRAIGLCVFVIALLMLVWKIVSPSPPLSSVLPRWQQVAAHAAHHLLLASVILLPLTGYLISTSAGKPIPMFDVFSVPAVLSVSESLRDLAIKVHFYLAYGTALLIAGHAGAALKHQFIDSDGTLAKMIWR